MSKEYPPISIIIPAYNEEGAVAKQIKTVRQTLRDQGIEHEIIIVDDGSEDKTAEEALAAGARLLQQPENRGYGASLKAGIVAARHDIIVITDADGTYPAEPIPEMLAKMETADMVVGSRTGDEVHVPKIRQLPKWFLRLLATHIAGHKIPDLNSGLRLFRRECAMQYFSILSDRFSFTTTITLSFMANNYRVVYHPINYYQRVGKSKIVPWHFMDFMILILRMSMIFNPLRVFVPLAVTFATIGAMKTIFDIYALFVRHPEANLLSIFVEPVISTSAILLLFVAVQLMMIGMMADGVVRRIAQSNSLMIPSHGNILRDYHLSNNNHKQTPQPEETTET
ncbi:MAG: glycosyltransferase family 2 protein [Chloroflexi bacterium]|nr:glycosyltransferase family 2 protein [Chloroflexota bacterium]